MKNKSDTLDSCWVDVMCFFTYTSPRIKVLDTLNLSSLQNPGEMITEELGVDMDYRI
jgi:hypothetical protein